VIQNQLELPWYLQFICRRFEYNTKTNEFIRWTESELGGMDVSNLKEPQLIKWKSFDGKEISGYLYKAASKFSGKRPVIINIHGVLRGSRFQLFGTLQLLPE